MNAVRDSVYLMLTVIVVRINSNDNATESEWYMNHYQLTFHIRIERGKDQMDTWPLVGLVRSLSEHHRPEAASWAFSKSIEFTSRFIDDDNTYHRVKWWEFFPFSIDRTRTRKKRLLIFDSTVAHNTHTTHLSSCVPIQFLIFLSAFFSSSFKSDRFNIFELVSNITIFIIRRLEAGFHRDEWTRVCKWYGHRAHTERG